MTRKKPRDRREYVRISVALPSHPKLAEIDSPHAGWLYVCGICHAGEHLTDGFIRPQPVARAAGVQPKWIKELVRVGLWHTPGHDCGSCPQPGKGEVVIHDYLEHQRSRSEADAARQAGRAAAEARWSGDAKGNAEGIADRNAEGTAESNGSPIHRQRQRESSYLLTLISRLAAGDVGPPPADVIDSWQQFTGPDVDLDAEAMAYLARYGDRPARDERGAWLGWLRKAADRHAAVSPQPATRERPLGCGDCVAGWLEYADDLIPRPCLTCKPHLVEILKR